MKRLFLLIGLACLTGGCEWVVDPVVFVDQLRAAGVSGEVTATVVGSPLSFTTTNSFSLGQKVIIQFNANADFSKVSAVVEDGVSD